MGNTAWQEGQVGSASLAGEPQTEQVSSAMSSPSRTALGGPGPPPQYYILYV
jgi:hypothetical protein